MHQESACVHPPSCPSHPWPGIEKVLACTHLPALLIPDQAMQEHEVEGRPAGELNSHHDHARHPEEQDVMASLQHLPGRARRRGRVCLIAGCPSLLVHNNQKSRGFPAPARRGAQGGGACIHTYTQTHLHTYTRTRTHVHLHRSGRVLAASWDAVDATAKCVSALASSCHIGRRHEKVGHKQA